MTAPTIPIFFCFDQNYVIPAAVAFYSLLENADRNNYYKLYVLHSDIEQKKQEKLHQSIKKFSNGRIVFIDMQNKFNDLWNEIKIKGHYSKECLYKLLPGTIFKEYDKIICSDVDVVFSGDISPSFNQCHIDDSYIAGIRGVGKLKSFYQDTYSEMKTEDVAILKSGICGGYLVYNLKKIREDKLEGKFLAFLKGNVEAIQQPEQDILNLVCYPKISYLPLRYCFCTYMYNLYSEKDLVNICVDGKIRNYFFKLYKQNLNDDSAYSQNELLEAFESPIQIHYATYVKPWNHLFTRQKLIWLKYLLKTPFFYEYIATHEIKNLKNSSRSFLNRFRTIGRLCLNFVKGKLEGCHRLYKSSDSS